MNGEKVLDITWGTIFKILFAVSVFYFAYTLRDFLIWFLFALAISILLDPPIDFLAKIKIPRIIGATFIYISIFGILGYAVYSVAPLFLFEIRQFSHDLPAYFEKVNPLLGRIGIKAFENLEGLFGFAANILEKSSANIFSATFSVFGGIFTTFFIFLVAIFISFEGKLGERTLVLFFPKKDELFITALWAMIKKKIGFWFLSRIIASLFVGVATYLVLLFLGINYPVSLAIFSGVFNFIPFIGPILTGILIFFVAFPQSLTAAIYALILFTVVQQIEGSVITPLLTRKFIGLPPVLVLLALSVGGTLWGVMGAILAIPLAGIVFEFTRDYLKKRREERAITI